MVYLSYNCAMRSRFSQLTNTPLKNAPLKWRILSTALIVQLATISFASYVAANTANESADSVEGVSEQIQQTDTLLKQLQQDIASSRLQKQKIADSLTAVQGNVSERTRRLKQLNKEIIRYNNELDSLSSSIEKQQQTIDKRKSLLADSVRKSQRVNTASGLKVILPR